MPNSTFEDERSIGAELAALALLRLIETGSDDSDTNFSGEHMRRAAKAILKLKNPFVTVGRRCVNRSAVVFISYFEEDSQIVRATVNLQNGVSFDIVRPDEIQVLLENFGR